MRVSIFAGHMAAVFCIWAAIISVETNSLTTEMYPLDVYVLMDRSGSISNYDSTCIRKTGLTCWGVMVNFVGSLVSKLSNVTGGLDEQGLRFGVLTFSCSSGSPVIRPILNPASGDQNAFDNAIARLNKANPNGGTCPSEGLEMIKTSIQNTAGLRPKAVLMMTDGLIENQDSARALSAGQSLRDQGALMFTLAIGQASNAADRQRQRQQLVGLSGDPSRVFNVDQAASLTKVVNIISAMALDKFSAQFGPEIRSNPAWCMSPNTSVVLAGPSVDHIEYGPSFAQSLLCTFYSQQNLSIAEVVAVRSQWGELTCLIPDVAFPASYNATSETYWRQATMGLTILETATGLRRSLKFLQQLSLPIASGCIRVTYGPGRCATDPLQIQLNILPQVSANSLGLRCTLGYDVESVLGQPVAGNMSVVAEFNSSVGALTCSFPLNFSRGSPSGLSLAVSGSSIRITELPPIPNQIPCFSSIVESTGCYGSDLRFTFAVSDPLTKSQFSVTDGRKCYFRATGLSSFSLVERVGPLTCSLPPFARGSVALTSADGLVIYSASYDGSAPDYPSDCFASYVLGLEQSCVQDGKLITIGFEGRAIGILNSIFSEESFTCLFNSTDGKQVSTLVTKAEEAWTCGYPGVLESALAGRTFNQVVLIRSSRGDALYQTSLSVPAQALCLDLIGDDSEGDGEDGVFDVCWGDAKARIIMTGESLGTLRSLSGVACNLTLHSMYGNQVFVAPITYAEDMSSASCFLPTAITDANVQLADDSTLTVGITYTGLSSSNKAILLLAKPFAFTLIGCTSLTPSTQYEVCWGSMKPSPFVLTGTTVQVAREKGFADFTCLFSDASTGNVFPGTSLLGGQGSDPSAVSCIPPTSLLQSVNAGSSLRVLLQIIANSSTPSTRSVVLDAYMVVVSLLDSCLSIGKSVSSVCWGAPWDVAFTSTDLVTPSFGSTTPTCLFDGGSRVVATRSNDGAKVTCTVPSGSGVKPKQVTLMNGLIAASSPQSIQAPTVTMCVIKEASKGDSKLDPVSMCAGTSAAFFRFSGATVAGLAQQNEFVVCVWVDSKSGKETRVPGGYVSVGTGNFALECRAPTWTIWDNDGAYQPPPSYSSATVVAGFSNDIIYSTALELPTGLAARGSSCANLTYLSEKPSCLYSNMETPMVAQVNLSGPTVDFLVQLGGSPVLCEFMPYSETSSLSPIAVNPVIDTANLILTCSLPLSIVPSDWPSSLGETIRLRLLVPDQLAIVQEYNSTTSVFESPVAVQSKLCFSTTPSSLPMLCPATFNSSSSSTQNITILVSDVSTAMFKDRSSVQCYVYSDTIVHFEASEGSGIDFYTLEGVWTDSSRSIIKCSGEVALQQSLAWGRAKINIESQQVATLPVCFQDAPPPLFNNPDDPETSKQMPSSNSGAIAGALVGVVGCAVLATSLFVVGRRRKNRLQLAAGSKENPDYVFNGNPISEAERQLAAVKNFAMESASSVRNVSALSSSARASSVVPKPRPMKETLNVDVSTGRVVVPEWVVELAKRPLGLFGFIAISKAEERIILSEAAIAAQDDEAWGVQDVLFQEPVTILPGDIIRISVDPRKGLGFSLGRTEDNLILIEKFTALNDGGVGPVESLGVVWSGDQLVEINDEPIKGWSLAQCSRAIRSRGGSPRISFGFKTSVAKSNLGYGAYQIIVPRGVHDLGVSFLTSVDLVVSSVNKFGPLRNLVPVGSRLTAVDGYPVVDERDLKQKLVLDDFCDTPLARLRFEAPRDSSSRRGPGAERPPLSPYAYGS